MNRATRNDMEVKISMESGDPNEAETVFKSWQWISFCSLIFFNAFFVEHRSVSSQTHINGIISSAFQSYSHIPRLASTGIVVWVSAMLFLFEQCIL